VSVLYALEEFGGVGATSTTLGKRCGVSTHSAAARAAWLRRGGLVSYATDGAIWRLTDDARGRLFDGTTK